MVVECDLHTGQSEGEPVKIVEKRRLAQAELVGGLVTAVIFRGKVLNASNTRRIGVETYNLTHYEWELVKFEEEMGVE